MFYDVFFVDKGMTGQIFYTVIGRDKEEIQRGSVYFSPPMKKKEKQKIKLVCGACHHKARGKK